MSQTFGCWSTLSESDKLLCFDAKSGPRRELQYQGQKLSAWPVAGKLRDEWNRVLLELKARTENINFKRIISPTKPNNATVRWMLYLAGKAAEPGKLRPMIVAESAEIEVAKRACKALQEMKKHSLAPLLGSYDMHFAQVQIRLRAEPSEIVSPSFSSAENSLSLCGQQVLISPYSDSETPAFTTSTVGGSIIIGHTYYALTAAHAFPERAFDHPTHNGHAHATTDSQSQVDGNSRNDTNIASYATSLPVSHYSVYVQKCDRDLINPGNLSVPDQPPPIKSKDSLINNASHRVILNRLKDWALIPIENRRFLHENEFTSPNGSVARVTGINENIPLGPVLIATGVSSPTFSNVSETTSLLLLPGCEQPQIVWSAEKRSAPGDCGSWIIDQNSKACAMVIAASEDDDEIYCLPLTMIFRNIQDQFGSDRQPELPLNLDSLPNPDRSPSVSGFPRRQSLPANGLSSSKARISNDNRISPGPIVQGLSDSDDYTTVSDSPQSESGASHGKHKSDANSSKSRLRKKKRASSKNVSTDATAAEKETGKPTEVGSVSVGHDSQVNEPDKAYPSNKESEVIESEQIPQGKQVTGAAVSFQVSGSDPSSPPPRRNERPPSYSERRYVERKIPQVERPDFQRYEDISIDAYDDRVPITRRPTRVPEFLREDYGRTAAGPIVLRAREGRDLVDLSRPRRRSPSPEPARKPEKEEIIIRRESRESTPRPTHIGTHVVEQEREVILERDKRDVDVPPCPPRRPDAPQTHVPHREEIVIRREEDDLRDRYESSRERISRRYDDARRRYDNARRRYDEVNRGYDDAPREEVIIRRHDDDRRSRYDDVDSRRSRRDYDDWRTPRDLNDKQEIAIRRERDRSVEQAPRHRERTDDRVPLSQQPQYRLSERAYHDADHIEIPRSSYESSEHFGGSRRAFQSLNDTTIVSRKEISPQALNEAGTQWDWDSYDDYYIRIASVGDRQMQRLRERTQRIFDGDLVNKSKSSHRVSGPANDSHFSDRNTDHKPQTRTEEVLDLLPGQRYVDNAEAELAIRVVEEQYREQVEQQNSIDSDCRVLDLKFEAMVQNLFWDAKLSPETCDILIKTHQEKEAKCKANSQKRLQRGATATSATQGNVKDGEGKSALQTCSMKLKVDGILAPCGEMFEEGTAMKKHEYSHLIGGPYWVEEHSLSERSTATRVSDTRTTDDNIRVAHEVKRSVRTGDSTEVYVEEVD